MSQRHRFRLLVAVLTLIYAIVIWGIWNSPRAGYGGAVPFQGIALAFLVALYVLLVLHLRSWLAARPDDTADMAIFIMVTFSIFFLLLASAFWLLSAAGVDDNRAAIRRFRIVPIVAVMLYYRLFMAVRSRRYVRTYDVPTGQTAVIQRNNVVHRLATAGTSWLFGADRVAYMIDIKPQQMTVQTDILRMNELAYKYTLRVRYRFSPPNHSPLDDDRLRRLSQTYAADRRTDVRTIVHNAVHQTMAQFQAERKDVGSIDQFDALLIVIPGMPESDRLLQKIEGVVAVRLAGMDVELNKSGGVTIENFSMPRGLQEELTQARIHALFQARVPTTDAAAVAQLLEWVGKAEPLAIRYTPRSMVTGLSSTDPGEPDPAQAGASTPFPDLNYTLTARDLSVMRVVPQATTTRTPVQDGSHEAPSQEGYSLSPRDLSVMRRLRQGYAPTSED